MQGRNEFLDELIHKIDAMIESIEDREMMEGDLHLTRELAEQLRDEVESLQD